MNFTYLLIQRNQVSAHWHAATVTKSSLRHEPNFLGEIIALVPLVKDFGSVINSPLTTNLFKFLRGGDGNAYTKSSHRSH